MEFKTRFVISASTPAHSSTSLKWGTALSEGNLPSGPITGGRSALFRSPSTRSEAGTLSFSPCCYQCRLHRSRSLLQCVRRRYTFCIVRESAHRSSQWRDLCRCKTSSPSCEESGAHTLRFVRRHLLHGGDQCRLAEAFFVYACAIEQVILDDGVVHSHTAFIEHTRESLS